MHLWYRTIAWIRNVSFFIGAFLAVQGIRFWKSVGNDMDQRPDDTFILAAVLIGIPLGITIFLKSMLTDRMNKHANTGNKLLETGKYHEALEAFDNAVSIKDSINKKVLPEEMVLHVYRAKAYIKLNDHKNAIEDLDRILNLETDLEIWQNLRKEASELKNSLVNADKS